MVSIHGYGSDFGGPGHSPVGRYPDRAWASVQIAVENMAIALSDMIDSDFIDLDDAKSIAKAWLFDNPNRFYRLGLEREDSVMEKFG